MCVDTRQTDAASERERQAPSRNARPMCPAAGAEVIRLLLERRGRLQLAASGQSMCPALEPNAVVTLVRAEADDLRRGDIAAVARDDGVVVLHRVIRPLGSEGCLTTWGDNCPFPDPPVHARRVLGKAVAALSRGRERTLPRRMGSVQVRAALLRLMAAPRPGRSCLKRLGVVALYKKLWRSARYASFR